MLWRRGWLVNSLKYHVEKDIRETIYKNKDFKKLRWSLVQRIIGWGTRHLILSNLLIPIAVLTIGFLISSKYGILRAAFPSLEGMGEVINFQNDLFVVQATLLGIIFPLVIAFIGILLQGKAANESMWIIYRHRSGFMLLGYASLCFLLFCVGARICQPWMSRPLQVGIAMSVVTWFLLNMLLSIWFLRATMHFLSIKKRMEMVTQYGLNEVVLSEVRSRLPVFHYLLAQKMNLLPRSKVGWYSVVPDLDKDDSCKIQINLSDYEYVVNIWYRFLNIAMFFWFVSLSYILKEGEEATLGITIPLDGYKHKELNLVQVDVGKFSPVSSFFIRNSITTSKELDCDLLSFDAFLNALFDPLESALVDKNSRAFDVAKSDLVKFYSKLEASMAFTNDEGMLDNWLFLTQGTMLSQNLLNDFVQAAEDITQKVVRRLNEETSYYETWCYFFIHLARDNSIKPTQVIETFISGHYRVWASLNSWMSVSTSDVNRRDGLQDRVIKHFIGSWESWEFLKQDEYATVTDLSFQNVLEHLENTSCMVVSAMKYDNEDTMRWAIDVLVHWYDLFVENDFGYGHYGWLNELVTSHVINDRQDYLDALVREGEFDASKGATVALTNYWVDIRVVTAAYLMDSTKYEKLDSYKDGVEALLTERRLEPTGTVELIYAPVSSPEELISVFLRQSLGYNFSGWQRTILGKHLDRLARIDGPEWVSGRIYSSSGSRVDHYLPKFFQVIGIGLTQVKFSLSEKWKGFLTSDAMPQRDKESLVRKLKALSNIDDSLLKYVCRQYDIELPVAQSRKELFASSIEDIIAKIENNIDQQIIDAEIDAERLKDFGLAASKNTFSLESGPLPILLFHSLEYVSSNGEGIHVIDISGYSKSAVAKGIDAPRAVNEMEWLQDIVKQEVAAEAFRSILRDVDWCESKHECNLELLRKVVKDGESITSAGRTPILFIGPWSLYRLIESSTWGYTEVKDKLPFDISKETGKGKGYICHLNGIEVYSLPFKKSALSLLVAKELFEKVVVQEFADKQYVDVAFNSDEGEITGTLSLSFGMDCIFAGSGCFKYISLKQQE